LVINDSQLKLDYVIRGWSIGKHLGVKAYVQPFCIEEYIEDYDD
jgi:hypothetical protein